MRINSKINKKHMNTKFNVINILDLCSNNVGIYEDKGSFKDSFFNFYNKSKVLINEFTKV